MAGQGVARNHAGIAHALVYMALDSRAGTDLCYTVLSITHPYRRTLGDGPLCN
jgi:hypothetical protein